MSHAIESKLETTKITDPKVLEAACKLMGLNFTEHKDGKGHYRTWKDDHGGNLVGDWPLPEGVTAAEVGNNADFVISVPASLDPRGRCYELGIVRNKKDNCWYPSHDFYQGGMGLEKHIGHTKLKGDKVVKSCGILMDHYKAAQSLLTYRARGKNAIFEKQGTKLVVYAQ